MDTLTVRVSDFGLRELIKFNLVNNIMDRRIVPAEPIDGDPTYNVTLNVELEEPFSPQESMYRVRSVVERRSWFLYVTARCHCDDVDSIAVYSPSYVMA